VPVRAGSWEEEGKDFSDLQATYAQASAEEITRQMRQLPTLAESERSKALVYLKGRYDSEILAVDQKVDGLLRALAAHEYDDANTIVVILADHGEEFLDHGGMLHSHTLRDELLRIPLILRGPGIPAGARIPDQVSLLDVTVTLLERAGVDTSGLVGQSLEPLFHSDLLTTSDEQRTASHGANHRLSLATLGTRYIAVRSDAEKLIVAYEPYDLAPLSWLPWKSLGEMTQVAIHRRSRPDVGYWNLEEDPGEKTNRLLQSKARARILYDALMETRRREPVRHVENTGSEKSAFGLLPEDRERLRKLGYVE
jgi:arylsulfatase A-like enzyme